MMAGVALCAALAFTSCRPAALDPNPLSGSEVKLASFGPAPILRLDTMVIYGAKLDQVTKVIFPAAEVEKKDFVVANETEIDLVVPDESRPGKIALLVGEKDTIWSLTPMTFLEPIEVTEVAPLKDVMPGTQITIKGDYVYNIADVTFQVGQKVNAVDFVKCERRELVITVPMGTVSGTVVMTDGADWSYEVEMTFLAAEYTKMSADSLDFGDELKIEGKNLNLVEKVLFGGGVETPFTINADGKSITATVPTDAAPGPIQLVQYSTNVVLTDTLALPVLSVSDVSPKAEVSKGMVITITGQLLNRATAIKTGGDVMVMDFQVNQEGTELTFKAPDGMADGVITVIQNANLSAQTAMVKMHHEGNIFYTVPGGGFSIGPSWSDWFQVAYNNEAQQLWLQTIKGAGKLTVNLEQTEHTVEAEAYSCIQMQYVNSVTGQWSGSVAQVDLAEGQTSAIFTIDADLYSHLANTAEGWVFGGHDIKILSFEWESADAPKTIWQGEQTPDWGNNVEIEATEVATWTAGQKLYITFTLPAEITDYHNIRIISSDWGFNPDPAADPVGAAPYNYSPSEDGVWEFAITEEFLGKVSGKGVAFTGHGVTLKQVGVK